MSLLLVLRARAAARLHRTRKRRYARAHVRAMLHDKGLKPPMATQVNAREPLLPVPVPVQYCS